MVHGDDKGMVMPPRVAPLQVIIIPIVYKEENRPETIDRCHQIASDLAKVGVRAKVDDRENYTPGWKYNFWEMKGVCVRMEIGPRDMKDCSARLVQRFDAARSDHQWSDLTTTIPQMLDEIHTKMLQNAKTRLDRSLVKVKNQQTHLNHISIT